jgi:hypothetical protein
MKYEQTDFNGEVAQNVSDNFAFYQELTREYALASPQRQGLTPAEFESALVDPSVESTEISTAEGTFRIPQLSPVEQNGWLNTDFYQRKFPEASSEGKVMYYVDLPSVEPGTAVKNRIAELAENDGVLVFDYPLADEQYPARVQNMLAEIGVTVEAEEELGNQTYFIAEGYLKRLTPDEQRSENALSIADAFEKLKTEGAYDPARIENGATLLSQVDEDQAKAMRQFYEDAYMVLNDHPCEQGLDPDEFMDMMTERKEVAKIVNSVDGEIVALVLLDNNLDKLSWVNPDYYKKNYAEKYENGQVMWFPGLAANPHKKEGGNLQVMVDFLCELVEAGGNSLAIAFDCCDMNTGFLDVALDHMLNKTPQAHVDFTTIAVQRYMALRLSKQ